MSLRIGVVGTGHWAATVHAAGAAAHEGVELVGVWGRDRSRAAAVADPLGTTAYDDFGALLDAVELLSFAVPPSVQADLATRAAEAGKHLLLEKPLTTDLEAADRLVAAVEEHDVRSVVFFTQRFVPAWESWLEEVSAQPLLGGAAFWLASLRTPDNPYASSVWRKEDGALWDVGPHALSILLPALGPVVGVTGVRGVDDLVHLVLTHEGGATSTAALSLTMPPDATRHGVELYGDHGWFIRPDLTRDVEAAYSLALDGLLESIASGRGHRCDVRFGRDVVEVLARAEQALEQRA